MNQFDMEELCKRLAPVIAAALSSSYREARLSELRLKHRSLANEAALVASEIKVLESFGGSHV